MFEPKIELIKRLTSARGKKDYWERIPNSPKFDSVPDLFNNIDTFLSGLSDVARTNIYYTQELTTKKTEDKPHSRLGHGRRIIVTDIDHINKEKEKELIEFVLENLGLNRKKVAIISTGYGLQFVEAVEQLFVATPIIAKYYCQRCKNLEKKIWDAGFGIKFGIKKTEVDISLIDPNKLARIGGTINHKEGREDAPSVWIEKNIEPQFKTVEALLGIPTDAKLTDEEDVETQKETLKVDAVSVKQGCKFLINYLEIPPDTNEPKARAVASILKYMPDVGNDEAVDFLKRVGDRGSSEALKNCGNKGLIEKVSLITDCYSCKTIENLDPLNSCQNCPFKGKVSRPIDIKSDSFKVSESQETGFRKKINKRWIVDNESLLLYFKQKHGYFISDEAQPKKVLYQFDGRIFKPLLPSFILKFCYDYVSPKPSENERNEFLNLLSLHNMRNITDLFHKNTEGKINFQNGVLHIETGELKPHSHAAGFTYYLHCDYDKSAIASKFLHTINEWLPTQDSIETYQMFGGDILAGGKQKAHKVLILTGNGRNGKSAAAEIIDAMLGGEKSDSASIAMDADDFQKSHRMADLQTKSLVIIDEQRPYLPAGFWENLKRLSAGGKITADKKFKDSQTFNNRARFMLIVNQLSSGTAQTEGFLSRLLIVNFPRFFKPDERDPHLVETLVETEAAGIANWFIEGFRRLKRLNFQFPDSGDLRQALDEYQEETNMLYAFCKHYHIELGDPREQGFATGNLELHKIGGKVSGVWADLLYNQYVEFVKAQYHEDSWSAKKVESRQIFGRKLNQKFNKKLGIKNTKANRTVITGIRVRGFDVDCEE